MQKSGGGNKKESTLLNRKSVHHEINIYVFDSFYVSKNASFKTSNGKCHNDCKIFKTHAVNYSLTAVPLMGSDRRAIMPIIYI